MTTIQQKTLILASSSPRRRELIASLRLPVTIIPSEADETVAAGLAPGEIVEALAYRKASEGARLASANGQEGIVIGSDTIVVLHGEVLGKPLDERDAERMLTALQGRSHEVYTGVSCIETSTGKELTRHRMTSVHMKPLTNAQIRSYIATGEPMDKAGSYAIQGIGAIMIHEIAGDYFNVVGLPLSLLADMLADFEVTIL